MRQRSSIALAIPAVPLVAALIALGACATSSGGGAGRLQPTTPVPVQERVATPERMPAADLAPQGAGLAPELLALALAGTAGDAMPATLQVDANGDLRRVRLVRGAGKYPLRRVEEVLVRRPDGVAVSSVREMVADHLLVSLGGRRAADVAAAAGCTVRRVQHGGNTALLAFDYRQHGDFDAFRARIAAVAGVRAAEPDWIVSAIGTPDDPSFAQLWGMDNAADHDIDAPEAWSIATGSAAVLVGVIDTGIDRGHPDLAANMWANPGETGLDAQGNPKQSNGIDDDGNGYVDDWRGWDFVNEDNDPQDDHYHGTHCAGTIGAVGGNGIGVAGVCWKVSMVGLKFLSASGSGAISDAVEAQLYANAIGCALTSNSWGGGGYSQAMKDAIDAAGAQGALFVAAAGNAASDNDVVANYPSNYDSANIIAVAATDSSDLLASFSCWGATTVDLGAPGVSIYSCQPGGLYQYLSGTSMATPHVAGACALLKSANPSLNGAQIKQALLAHTDPVPALAGKTVTGGRLNLRTAVQSISGPVAGLGAVAVSEVGDGDGLLNPGEQAVLGITLASVGSQTLAGLQAVIACNDPSVAIEQDSASYGDLAPGQSASGSVPFRVRLSSAAGPHTVELALTASAGGSSWSFTVPVAYVASAHLAGSVRRSATGAAIAGATVTWTGPHAGSAITAADGTFSAVVPEGAYQVRASASGLNPGPVVPVSMPPETPLELLLGAAQLAVTPSSITLSSESPLAPVQVANGGDAPLAFTVANPAQVGTSGLWHASSLRTATGSGTAWYYGDETKRNFDTGARTSGALAFPVVAVPTTDPTLRFSSWRSTESGPTYDQSLVQVSTDGGQSWLTIASAAPRVARRDGLADADMVSPAGTWKTLHQETDVSMAWHDVSVDLAAYAGSTIALRFWFDSMDSILNATEGWYVDAIRVGTAGLDPWLAVSPASGTVPAGSSATLQFTALPTAVPTGSYSATVLVAGDVPGGATVPVQVTFTKAGQAELAFTSAAAGDAALPAVGDGDGVAEPGETIALLPTWRNLGTVTAVGAVASVGSTSPYVQIINASAALPDIAGGGSAAPAVPFAIAILPGCPDNTAIPLTYAAILPGGTMVSAPATLLVRWASRLSGTVRNGLGQPVAGATIQVGALSAVSSADGAYAVAGIAAGNATAIASKPGARQAQTTIATPPDAGWDPVVGTPGFAVPADPLYMAATPGYLGISTVTLSNPGDVETSFSVGAAGGAPTADGLWHLSNYRTIDYQPTWYYGDEAKRTFDTGARTSGGLTFADVVVPAGTPQISWQQWRQTEGTGTTYDIGQVQVSLDGTTWATLHQTVLNDSAWHTVSTSIAAYAGKTVRIRFWFDSVDGAANAFEGWYVGDIRVGGSAIGIGGSWLSASPLNGTIPAGGETEITVVASAANLGGGIYKGRLDFTSDAPSVPTASLPVTFTVLTPPSLSIGAPVLSDAATAPTAGDGDGKAEPGETIAWSVPLTNSGTLPAMGVFTTLSSTSPYVSFPVAGASYGNIEGLATAQPAAPCIIAIAPGCPSGTTIPITCSIDSSSGTWSGSLSLLVKWDCRVQGWVTEVGTGARLAGATVTCGAVSALTAADGTYVLSGLPAGNLTVVVSKSGYATISGGVVTPPDVTFKPALGVRDLAVSPTILQATIARGASATLPVIITGTGTIATNWAFSSLPSWVSILPTAGLVGPGLTMVPQVTMKAGTLGNGVYNATCYLNHNSTKSPAAKPISLSLTVRSANPPTAGPVAVSMQEDGSAQIQLLGSDADADPLSYAILGQPAHGVVTLGANGLATYVPSKLYHGDDAFTFRVSDGLDISPPATVSIAIAHVNHVPRAWPTVVHVAVDQAATFSLPCADDDQDPLGVRIAGPPRVGEVTCAGTSATYLPPAGFSGQDVFTIAASDGLSESAVVQVMVVVGGVQTDASWTTLGNGPEHLGVAPQPLGSLSMQPLWTVAPGFPLHQVAIGGGRVYYTSRTYFGAMRAAAVDPASGAELWRRDFPYAATLNPPTYDDGSVYLQRGYASSDSQLWRISADGGATVWSAPYAEQWEHHQAPTVSGGRVWVNGGTYGGMYGFDRALGSQAFFQGKQQYDQWTPTLSGGVLYAWAGNVLAAHEPQGGAVQWSLTLPTGATPYSQYGAVVADAQRAYVIAGGGALYAVDLATHQLAWTRSGTYRGMPALHEGRLFVYTAAGVEQVTAASGDTELLYPCAGLAPGAAASIQPIVTSDALIAATGSQTLLFARGDATLRFSAPYGGHISLAGNRLYIAGSDLRAYRIGNRAPTAVDRTASMLQDASLELSLWGADADDDLLSWTLAAPPTHGAASIAGGRLTYVPAAGFAGDDELAVAASDAGGTSAPATVRITVVPLPVAQPLQVVVRQGQTVAIALAGSSPRGQALSYAITQAPASGVLEGTAPLLTFAAPAGEGGEVTCAYTVTDAVASSHPATITITVTPDLPAGWAGADIGATGAAGATYQEPVGGAFVATGAGVGVGGTADSGQTALRGVAGDCDVVARVPLPASTASTARVGIVVRESADPGSRGVFLGMSGVKKAVWSRRTTTAATASTSSWTVSTATWFKVSRRGNVLWCYRSADGAAWTLCGNVTIAMPDLLQVGTLVASGTAGTTLQARIESFAVTAPSPMAVGALAINFQAGKDAPTVADGMTWQIADGAPYGARWAGTPYGFAAVSTSTYNRNSTLSLDERYDTGIATSVTNAFEVAVPPGAYTVTVCVGDANASSGKLYPEVEGVRAATGVATATTRWFTGTVDVEVLDGRLTLRCGSGASAARWAWLLIQPQPVAPPGDG